MTEILPKGSSDTQIFLELSNRECFLMTQDHNMKRKKHQREAMRQAGISAFIFTGRAQKSVEEMMIKILQRFPEIEELALTTQKPFIYGIPDRGKADKFV